MTARRALLDGLDRDADIVLASMNARNDTFPGEVFLDLTADALEWSGANRDQWLSLEGLRERPGSGCGRAPWPSCTLAIWGACIGAR